MNSYYQAAAVGSQGWPAAAAAGKAGKEGLAGMSAANMANPWAGTAAAALSQDYSS